MHSVEGPVDPGAGCSDIPEEEVKNEVPNEGGMVNMNEELRPNLNAGNDVNIDGSLKLNPVEESTDVRADYFSSLTAVFNDGLNLTISPAKQAYKSPWKVRLVVIFILPHIIVFELPKLPTDFWGIQMLGAKT
ncbi:hypothetical protein PHET_05724 [Paragonimus heterotremus]|uniref:Uncharacterized protein n=1 Tax=Paragonimus heterotremus TaxID=100268 RepID=A0A8J4TJM5_9TREM|nr:hypothetical protein PHET_05724 [Paragonimus heterotremus]